MALLGFNPPALLRGSRNTKLEHNSPRMSTKANRVSQITTRRVLLSGALAAGGMFFLPRRTSARADVTDRVTKTEEEWRKILTPAQFRVLRKSGTEWAFTSPLNSEYGEGIFLCAGCGNPLFSSETKFDSGTGWPSFFKPLPGAVSYIQTARDRMLMQREVLCGKCDGHLGHVFPDGPKPTGLRYCMNGVAMEFEPRS